MANVDRVWQETDVAKRFLMGVRGAIPLANVQIDTMIRIIRAFKPSVKTVLDLGCGDGVLGRAVLSAFPEAHMVFMDFSEVMLDAARSNLIGFQNADFILCDYGDTYWVEEVTQHVPFDVVVSGFSIHHQSDGRKREIYQEIFNVLSPGGVFLNLEHVSSPSEKLEVLFDELMIDHMYHYQVQHDSSITRQQVAEDHHTRPDKIANILASVELQNDWLREIGFNAVDCYLKIFELALFGGVKP